MTRPELEPGPSEVSLEATKITSNALALKSSMSNTRILLTLASVGYIMKLHVAVLHAGKWKHLEKQLSSAAGIGC